MGWNQHPSVKNKNYKDVFQLNLAECTQGDVCNQKFIGIEEKMQHQKDEIADIKVKVNDLDKINITLVELKMLSEQNITANTERDKMTKVNTEALIQVSHTLETLCREFKESKDYSEVRDNKINSQFKENQKAMESLKGDINKKLEEQDDKIDKLADNGKIKINDLIKYGITAAIGAGATYYITTLLTKVK